MPKHLFSLKLHFIRTIHNREPRKKKEVILQKYVFIICFVQIRQAMCFSVDLVDVKRQARNKSSN